MHYRPLAYENCYFFHDKAVQEVLYQYRALMMLEIFLKICYWIKMKQIRSSICLHYTATILKPIKKKPLRHYSQNKADEFLASGSILNKENLPNCLSTFRIATEGSL